MCAFIDLCKDEQLDIICQDIDSLKEEIKNIKIDIDNLKKQNEQNENENKNKNKNKNEEEEPLSVIVHSEDGEKYIPTTFNESMFLDVNDEAYFNINNEKKVK